MNRNRRPRDRRTLPGAGRSGRTRLLAALAAAALLGCAAAPAAAAVRTEIPGEDPGPPFYARVERQVLVTDLVPHTDEWAAIVFYRSPACTPPGFNLMDLFDPPAAFGCRLTVDGFEIWRNGPPPVDFTPMFARLEGLGAVPVWIVSWPELQAAAADDVLTVPEVMALPSLMMGTASFYRESLHPADGVQEPKISLTAHGTLEDGRVFGLHHTGNPGGLRTVLRIFD